MFRVLITWHRLENVPQIALSQIGENGRLPVKVLFEGNPIKNLRVLTGCENLNSGKIPLAFANGRRRSGVRGDHGSRTLVRQNALYSFVFRQGKF